MGVAGNLLCGRVGGPGGGQGSEPAEAGGGMQGGELDPQARRGLKVGELDPRAWRGGLVHLALVLSALCATILEPNLQVWFKM